MRNTFFKEPIIAVAVLLTFFAVFKLLRNPVVYEATLGMISHNYERSGTRENFSIDDVNKPYVSFDKETINHWDAELYKDIRDDFYEVKNPLLKEKPAFYPLFPLVWKLSCIDSRYIVVFNYALFIAGLLILLRLLVPEPPNRLLYCFIATLVPTAVTFYLPYAESLFVLTFAVAVLGIFKNKYWVYFTGAFLFCTTRPAALIFITALLATDLVYFIMQGNAKHFIKEFLSKMLPCVLGYAVVTVVQFLYTGSWTAYFDALAYWPTESGLFNTIIDWSVEGFGMTVFAVFFVCLPALIYLLLWGLKSLGRINKQEKKSVFGEDVAWKKEYLFHLSLAFIAGNLLYTFFTSGNAINGFSRYTMAVPFFYIVLFLVPDRIQKASLLLKSTAFMACLVGMTWFLSFVIYGGDRFRFEYTGLLLFVLLGAFVLFESYLPAKLKWPLLIVLAVPCIVWQTYLFNMFLSNAWIFT